VECHLNNAYNKTIGDNPFHVLFGYHPSFRDGVLHHATQVDVWDSTAEIQSKIRERIAKEHQMWKKRYDSRHIKPMHYDVGEVVFIRKPPDATGESTKLQFKYRGPLVITEVLPNDVYRVSGLKAEASKRYVTVGHVSHIKGYHLPENEEPFGETTSTKQDEESKTSNAPNAVVKEDEQSESANTHSKRERKAPSWHASYKMCK